MRSFVWSVIAAWIFVLMSCYGVAWGSAVVSSWPAPVKLAVLGLILIVGAGAALMVRRSKDDMLPPASKYTYDMSQEQGNRKGENIIHAAALAEQRKSGRWLGGPVYVTWQLGQDQEIDMYARWLEKNGPANQVYITLIQE